MATIIGLKEFRQNVEAIAERVNRGESFIVVKRSKPIFQLGPVNPTDQSLDNWLDHYITENNQLLKSLADK